MSNLTEIKLNITTKIATADLNDLQSIKIGASKINKKKTTNIQAICTVSTKINLPNNKKMTKLQLINKPGNVIIDCVIWKNNLLIKKDYLYNFNNITCEEDVSSIKLSFNKFTTFKEIKEEIITMKEDLKNLSLNSDCVMYSTYASFEKYSNGWCNGRILNISIKNNHCFKVVVNLDNKDKIFFFTAFDKDSLLPAYATSTSLENLNLDIGKTKKFFINVKKKKKQKTKMDSSVIILILNLLNN